MFVAETKQAATTVTGLCKGVKVSWKDIAAPAQPFLEKVASQLASQISGFEPEIAGYAQYALASQGKQMRPALVALSGTASGRANDSLVTVAVIIEMVHLATLVHDDVMDSAQMRRRRPTLAANWGNEISVLLGDCLFAQAVKLAAGFPTTEICRAVATATKTVCSGEIIQAQQRGNLQLTDSEYFRILAMKTAELFALSCDLGASQTKAPVPIRTALRHYGMALGTAYQVYDDCLDLFGRESEAGKSLGTDLANGKFTLPILVAWKRADDGQRGRLRDLIMPWDRKALSEVIGILDHLDALGECRRVIHQYLDAAHQHLSILENSESRDALHAFCAFLAQQTDQLGVNL